MSKWKKVKISDSFILQMGKTPSRNEPSFWNNPLYNWVSISDMNQKYICSTKEKISPIALEKTGIKKVPKGTIMLSFKLSLGKVSISALDLYTNEAIMSFFPKNKNEWNIDFLYNYFKWLDWGKKAQKAVKGSTLNKNSLGNIEIPLPPMEEQKEIAARLDAVSDLLAKQKQLLAEQDTLIQSTFYDMFGEHQLSQQKGQWNKISDVAVIAGGSTPKTQTPEYWDGDLNWFTPAELENCSWYVYSSQRKITKAGVKSCHLEEFPINTVLLSSRAPIGKLAIARETFYCNQGFKNIICGETVNPIYLYHLLMYNINYMKSLGKGATFKEISKKIVEDIKIPVPPLELQEKFAAIVKQIESEKSKIKSAIAETQTLFNALMAEYFEE